ncbi:MAG: KamA family radical SAM protein [Silvanigrellales bacterium]|nr:KamA family radical SAM protein [Silvanigrellales bacterium]
MSSEGTSLDTHPGNWARALSKGLIEPVQLVREGLVGQQEAHALDAVKDVFDIRVPQAFLAGIRAGDATLARQVVPRLEELVFLPEELEDPIGDERFSPVEGLTHRYPDRALLKVTYQCASYCRFCFRRYKVSDADNNLGAEGLERAFEYLRAHTEIREVILTGGDPLSLTDAKLAPVFQSLAGLSHVAIVRIHTRIPTVLPERVTPELLAVFRRSGKAVWVVAHINAVSELTDVAKASLGRLVDGGIPVLAQSVLLKGVNDSHEALVALYRSLVTLRVVPYYLHYPDLARGTNHFRVPLSRALALVRGLRGNLSGFAIPRLILDIPGGTGKIVVEPEWARQTGPQTWVFTSPVNGAETVVNYPEEQSFSPE